MPSSPFLQPPPITLLETILKPLKVSLTFLPTEVTKERFKSYVWTEEVLSDLIPYYIPSMLDRFFENNYPINTVTIIRHILKEYDIKLITLLGNHDIAFKNTLEVNSSELLLNISEFFKSL